MFNVGAAELILILLVAFIVVGPKDLPKVARALGRFVRYIRSFIEEVKRETGWGDLTEGFKEAQQDVQDTLRQADVSKELKDFRHEVNRDVNAIKKDLRKDATRSKRTSRKTSTKRNDVGEAF